MPYPRFISTLALLTAGMLAGLSLATTTAAQAAYPGQNGRIAFAANLHGTWQVYTMHPDGTGRRQVTSFPGSDFGDLFPDWAPDGTELAFDFPGEDTGDLEMWTVNADGSGLTQLTHNAGGDDLAARWSPDGAKIVFAHTGPYGANAIWVMNANGSGMKRLTGNKSDSFAPAFTPDGQKILYQSSKRNLVSAIWIMNADGSDKIQLTPAKLEAGNLDVSPDGTHVVFKNHENTANPTSLFVMNIDGSGIHRLTRPPAGQYDQWPKYSPDGTKIVFQSTRPYRECFGCQALFEMNADGTHIAQVTTDLTGGDCPFCGGLPDWGPKPGT